MTWTARLWWWASPLLCTPDGRACGKLVGACVVGVVWTAYMVTRWPDSVDMWTAYAAVVLGWGTLHTAIDRMGRRGDRPDGSDGQ